MITILIVDDNKKRYQKLLSKINELSDISFVNIKVYEYADEARLYLKENECQLLILDVILPKKEGSLKEEETAIKLLKDIHTNRRYFTPSKIIGISEYSDVILSAKESFEEYGYAILSAHFYDNRWITSIENTIKSLVNTEIRKIGKGKNNLIIAIHGIRTYGEWQNDLKEIIEERSSNTDYIALNYGYLSLLTYILPFLRFLTINDVKNDLLRVIIENEDKNIHIIAHSFGTYVLMEILFKESLNKKIKTIILSGSVLPVNYFKKKDISTITERFINDCGTKDYVLLTNKIFILGLADGGRTGFKMIHSDNRCNRYFKGGHSLYFNKDFYKKNWLPYILTDKKIESISERTHSKHEDFSEFLWSFLFRIKYVWYILLVSILIYKFV